MGTPLSRLVYIVATFFCVVLHSHSIVSVLQWIGRCRLPAHYLVLGLEPDILGSSVCTNGCHAVPLVARALVWDVSLLKYMILVESKERSI